VGIDVALGSDSQAHIDLLDEARQLEGHLRLLRLGRAVLVPRTPTASRASALGLELLTSLTTSGARSLGVSTGTLAVGEPADFVTLDLAHPSIASVPTASLVTAAMMAASSAAIRDVAVAGRLIVKDGVHPLFNTSVQAFAEVMRALP
jgi:formimidoylglutamate deiminase